MRTKFQIVALLLCAAIASPANQHKGQREYEQGLKYEQAGQWEPAWDYFSKSITAEPTVQAYVHRAKAKAALGVLGKAIEDLTEAIRLAPSDAEVVRFRGETYVKLNNHRNAITDLKKAIELGANTSTVYAACAASADLAVSLPLGLAAFYGMCRAIGVTDLDMAIRAVARPIRRRMSGLK